MYPDSHLSKASATLQTWYNMLNRDEDDFEVYVKGGLPLFDGFDLVVGFGVLLVVILLIGLLV